MSQSADPLPFELRSLEVFLSVCDSGTMSGAARILGLTQSAVSQTIAELEQRVNADLFDRNVRPLGLTVSGVLLRQRASALIADARQIAPLLRDVRRNKLPLIRVGLVNSFSRLLVPDLPEHLGRFADHVSFVSGLTSSHVDDLLARKLDILLGVDEFEALDGIESWPLLEEPYVVIAPPEHAEAGHRRGARRARQEAQVRALSSAPEDRRLDRAPLAQARRRATGAPTSTTPLSPFPRPSRRVGRSRSLPRCASLNPADIARNFVCHPLPGPGLKRRLSLIARVRELARVPREAADFAIGRLNGELAPTIAKIAPWASAAIAIGDQIRRSL